jgi:hypothetical protein
MTKRFLSALATAVVTKKMINTPSSKVRPRCSRCVASGEVNVQRPSGCRATSNGIDVSTRGRIPASSGPPAGCGPQDSAELQHVFVCYVQPSGRVGRVRRLIGQLGYILSHGGWFAS